MSECLEKPYMSQSMKKIQPKKDLSRLLMYRDFKKSRKNSRKLLFQKKYYSCEDYTTDDIIFTKSNPSEWVFPQKDQNEDSVKAFIMNKMWNYYYRYLKKWFI